MEGNGGEKKEGEKEQKILTLFCLCKIKYKDLFVFFSSAFSGQRHSTEGIHKACARYTGKQAGKWACHGNRLQRAEHVGSHFTYHECLQFLSEPLIIELCIYLYIRREADTGSGVDGCE